MSAVLVTGAGRGLGRATALRLARSGWDVYAGVRDPAAGAALASASASGSARITPVPLDVTDAGQVAALRTLPALDAVVNNAGIAVAGPVEVVEPAAVRHQFEVNVVGQIAVTQAVLPLLRASRGRIVFVSSLNGLVAIPMTGVYDASKFALEAVADALRVELRPWRIGVSLVEPGCHDTDPWREMMQVLDGVAAGMPAEQRELYAAHLAGQRALCTRLQQQVAPAENVAAAVERVLTARRPPARTLVGRDARMLVGMRRLLPTRLLDRVWASGLGLPRHAADGARA